MPVQKLLLQLKPLIPTLALYYVLSIGLLIFAALLADRWHWPIERFTRDPAAIFKTHPFTGMISNIGALFWCSTAAICIFSALILVKKNKTDSIFLFFSGLFTTILLIDDFFMFHDYVLPVYLKFSEKAIYAGYFIMVLSYFLTFAKRILKTDYVILLIACGFLGLSVVCDMCLDQKDWEFLLEDGFKLFGIVTWSIYFSRVCLIQFREKFAVN